MARFSKGLWAQYLAAQQGSYEAGSVDLIESYLSAYGSKTPKWAVRELEKAAYNVKEIAAGKAAALMTVGLKDVPDLSGVSVVDALIRIDKGPGGQELRTARVHVESWMRPEDVLNEIQKIIDDHNKKYKGGASAYRMLDWWRVR